MQPHRNALIDGWRGVSISFVIAGHLLHYRFGAGLASGAGDYAQTLASQGVNIFFLISGFLITSILLAEENAQGRIHIVAFYVRRCFRILPAFYVMLGVAVVLGACGLIRLPDGAALRSGLFVCNFSGASCSWWLAHTWSLGVEEQFYWIWPAMFLLPREARKMCLLAMVVCLPIGAQYMLSNLLSFEYIALGAFVALFGEVRPAIARFAASWLYPGAVVLVLALPLLSYPAVREATKLVQPPLLAFVVFGALTGRGLVTRLISLRPVQKIGVVSYSLYLWQQFSLAPLQWVGTQTGAEMLRDHAVYAAAFVAPALASYFLLERPFIALGRRLSNAMIARRTAGAGGLALNPD